MITNWLVFDSVETIFLLNGQRLEEILDYLLIGRAVNGFYRTLQVLEKKVKKVKVKKEKNTYKNIFLIMKTKRFFLVQLSVIS